ncbi:MAG: 16S rRNA (adenine(1518)-N(6)/adenine(1519)-N(6))-dimethyltransferase RsmA [Flavobacteriales bacterium]|nr:16S rRNA (adenine(1518)-N(6)/adenine(1519)-N(6))-dimethyltransferase RsmA [Flavobacteriales bacterium]
MVRPKKHLGQHFLHDKNIAAKIADSLTLYGNYKKVLEVGPGTGALTQFLLQKKEFETSVIEVDIESVEYLKEHYPQLKDRIHFRDFLRLDLNELFSEPVAIAGNFPYNISSQIVFKIIEHKNLVPEMVGMFQKEMAERIAEKPGTKTYGIISVLTQAFYRVEYLFTVHENVFTPPPKVKSAVIRLQRNDTQQLGCDEKLFVRVVKTAFNQRRKTIRNSVKQLNPDKKEHPYLDLRPERLSVEQFVELTNFLDPK